MNERVPLAALYTIAVIVPAVVIAVYTLLIDGIYSHHKSHSATGSRTDWWKARWTLKERLWELNCGILGLFLASGTAYVITAILKNAAGKPRPDLIARCLPKEDAVDAFPFGLSNDTICTQTDHSILKDGFRSFPSGHSSSSWGGLFYLSLFLAGKMHLLDNRGEVWKVFVCLVPTASAALVAVSRIEDARHHPFDVIFGSLLGTVCAYVSYRQYFPSLGDTWRKGRAYPIRSWGTEPVRPETMTIEREVARDKGRDRLHSAPLPNMEWAPSPLSEDAENGVHSGNVFREQVANSERLRQQEFPGAPRFDGPVVERVQRLRSHTRNDSDLHLGRQISGDGQYYEESEDGRNESFEMQSRQSVSGQHTGAHQSQVDLHAVLQRGPYGQSVDGAPHTEV